MSYRTKLTLRQQQCCMKYFKLKHIDRRIKVRDTKQAMKDHVMRDMFMNVAYKSWKGEY